MCGYTLSVPKNKDTVLDTIFIQIQIIAMVNDPILSRCMKSESTVQKNIMYCLSIAMTQALFAVIPNRDNNALKTSVPIHPPRVEIANALSGLRTIA